MSRWSYAQLSLDACKAGGPEKYKEALICSGKTSMLPWIFGSLIVGGLVVSGFNKAKKYFKNRKHTKEEVIIVEEDSKTKKRFFFKLPRKIRNILVINYK